MAPGYKGSRVFDRYRSLTWATLVVRGTSQCAERPLVNSFFMGSNHTHEHNELRRLSAEASQPECILVKRVCPSLMSFQRILWVKVPLLGSG